MIEYIQLGNEARGLLTSVLIAMIVIGEQARAMAGAEARDRHHHQDRIKQAKQHRRSQVNMLGSKNH